MAIVEELIRKSKEGIDFGNYKLEGKAKLEGFSFEGDVYKIKTFKDNILTYEVAYFICKK